MGNTGWTKPVIRERLRELADEQYARFAASLLPNVKHLLGVRLPLLRKLAAEIARDGWREYLEAIGYPVKPEREDFIIRHEQEDCTDNREQKCHIHNRGQERSDADPEQECFEEVMLHGLVIGCIKTDIETLLGLVADFVPRIDNWSVCDSFCAGLKFTRQHKECVWNFLQPYFASKEEYELRFAIVMLLDYYIEDVYIDRVLQILDSVKHSGYYVKMAVAWAVSICFISFPEPTLQYLMNNTMDDFTYNKSLQKITESYRVNPELKERIRRMRRK